MIKWSLVALMLVAVVGATAAGFTRSEPSPATSRSAAAMRPPSPLLGFVPAPRSAARERPAEHELARIDPRTLRPRRGPRVAAGSAGCASRSGGEACWTVPPWGLSPDGSGLAFARNDGSAARSVRLVDIERMRVAADVPITGGAVGLVAWPARTRVLAVQEICCDEREQLLVLDLARRRVAARRPLDGTVVGVARSARDLVLLLAPAQEIGAARLALVDEHGAVRIVALDRMLAGSKLVREPFDYRLEQPGLAVDPEQRRAFVISRGLVAEIDLVRGAVSYHELTRPVSLLGRLRDWLEPAAEAKGATGPTRSAHWLGDGRLAVVGSDQEYDSGGEPEAQVRPAGLSLVDTHDWSVRTIDRGATDVRVAGDLLLATGWSWDTATGDEEAIGLTAYGLDGERRFQLFDGRQAWVEQVHGKRAYVAGLRLDGVTEPLRIVDLVTGRTVGERTGALPWLLLAPASSWWDG